MKSCFLYFLTALLWGAMSSLYGQPLAFPYPAWMTGTPQVHAQAIGDELWVLYRQGEQAEIRTYQPDGARTFGRRLRDIAVDDRFIGLTRTPHSVHLFWQQGRSGQFLEMVCPLEKGPISLLRKQEDYLVQRSLNWGSFVYQDQLYLLRPHLGGGLRLTCFAPGKPLKKWDIPVAQKSLEERLKWGFSQMTPEKSGHISQAFPAQKMYLQGDWLSLCLEGPDSLHIWRWHLQEERKVEKALPNPQSEAEIASALVGHEVFLLSLQGDSMMLDRWNLLSAEKPGRQAWSIRQTTRPGRWVEEDQQGRIHLLEQAPQVFPPQDWTVSKLALAVKWMPEGYLGLQMGYLQFLRSRGEETFWQDEPQQALYWETGLSIPDLQFLSSQHFWQLLRSQPLQTAYDSYLSWGKGSFGLKMDHQTRQLWLMPLAHHGE